MKKNFIFLFISVLFLTCTAVRCGDEYADKYKNVKWTCSQLQMEFCVYEEGEGVGTIQKDGQTINIKALWGVSSVLHIYSNDDKNALLIAFTYTIKNRLVTLTISQDNLFEGKYDNSKLKLICEDL